MVRNRKKFIWNIPFFGVGTIFFGVAAENITAQSKQYTAFVRFLGGDARVFDSKSEVCNDAEANLSRKAEIVLNKIRKSGLLPKQSKSEIKIFTFGLFVVRINSRIRAGFIKRRQILVEA